MDTYPVMQRRATTRTPSGPRPHRSPGSRTTGGHMADTECPNSTASGCRCPQHHEGLRSHCPDPEAWDRMVQRQHPPVQLTVVTAGPPTLSSDQIVHRLLQNSRNDCPSCHGDRTRCLDGTGAPGFHRLPGCTAYTAQGDIAALRTTRFCQCDRPSAMGNDCLKCGRPIPLKRAA